MEMIPVYGEQEHFTKIAIDTREYEKWCSEIVNQAIANHGYHIDVIQPLVDAHLFQKYFTDSLDPNDAILKYMEEN